jgi:hypothetical protein
MLEPVTISEMAAIIILIFVSVGIVLIGIKIYYYFTELEIPTNYTHIV